MLSHLFKILQRRCFRRNVLLRFKVKSYQTTRKSILRLAVHSACIPGQHLTHSEQTGPSKEDQETRHLVSSDGPTVTPPKPTLLTVLSHLRSSCFYLQVRLLSCGNK